MYRYLPFLFLALFLQPSSVYSEESTACQSGYLEITQDWKQGWQTYTSQPNPNPENWTCGSGAIGSNCSQIKYIHPVLGLTWSGFADVWQYQRLGVCAENPCTPSSGPGWLYSGISDEWECTDGCNVYTDDEAISQCGENLCTNGIQDDGEDGTDCGGSCATICVASCPPDTLAQQVIIDGKSKTDCVSYTDPNSFNECPDSSWTYIPEIDIYDLDGSFVGTDPATCKQVIEPTLSAEPKQLDPIGDPWADSDPTGDYTGDGDYDPGDWNPGYTNPTPTDPTTTLPESTTGTASTSTSETTTTNPDGSTTTTGTSTTTLDLPDISGQVSKGVQDALNNANVGPGYVDVPEPADDFTPVKKDLGELLVYNLPQLAIFNDSKVELVDTTCSFTWAGVGGHPVEFSFCRWESELTMMGNLLVSIVSLLSIIYFFKV